MKEIFLRDTKNVRLMGRDDHDPSGFSPYWSGSGLELNAKASTLELEIDCAFFSHKPYLSFEVDGLRAQTLSPLPGVHFYNLFSGLNGEKTHRVRVIRETQPFEGDPEARLKLIRLRTDGKLLPPPRRVRRLEFIGDSITSGEGGRGPVSFMEWVPMVFCAADNYTRFTADRLRADYQVISQSGYGFLTGWDNRPESNLPALYDEVCAVTRSGRVPYDFAFHSDTVVIALGTNDRAALSQPAYTDAQGVCHKLTPADGDRLEDAAFRFLAHIHEKNPGAQCVWMLFSRDDVVFPAVERAVSRAVEAGLRARLLLPFDLDHPLRGGRGSRSHPGLAAHRRISQALSRALKADAGRDHEIFK